MRLRITSAKRSGYRDGYGASSPVGSFAPNALGLYDLVINVSNWANATKTRRIFRGGTWEDDQPRNFLSSRRTAWVPDLSAGNSPHLRLSLRHRPCGEGVTIGASLVFRKKEPPMNANEWSGVSSVIRVHSRPFAVEFPGLDQRRLMFIRVDSRLSSSVAGSATP